MHRSLLACAIAWISFASSALAQLGINPKGDPPPQPPFPCNAAAANDYQRRYARWVGWDVEFVNKEGITFTLIPPGTYRMGSPAGEEGRKDDETQHTVTLTRPFYLSIHETTHEQFKRFVAATEYVTDGEKNGGGHAHDAKAEWKHRPGTNWRQPGFAGPFEMNGKHPVVHVSHADALAYCRWLEGEAPLKLNHGIRAEYGLATEAQWEWACRAGSSSGFWWGEDDDMTGRLLNAGDRALKKVHPEWPREIMPMNDGHAFLAPVGTYARNGFGLYDMLGNVWEFCSTKAGPYGSENTVNPGDLDPKAGFAVRGGGWSNVPGDCRSAGRNADGPHFCHSNLGFRVAIQLSDPTDADPAEVLAKLQLFYKQTARPDGSFQNGIDPDYKGMSDSAYSDLAAVTYAVTIHKTFGWKLPDEAKTIDFLLSRQKENGDFFNVAGTVDPKSAEGRTYNTTQALVALHALGVKPKYDPLPVFEAILKEDYKSLPAYSTSFFPLAYLCAGKPIPEKADAGIRALMVQDDSGYLNNHVAATFHASHYYNLVGEPTPLSELMVMRMVREQKKDGSWMLHAPARDRHATFDAVFTLTHEDAARHEEIYGVRRAIRKAARWAMSCRNADGGFGHYPGSTSDADAIYFQVGTLVMAGILKPADPLPADPHLLSWGHLMPVKERVARQSPGFVLSGWPASLAFDPKSQLLAVGTSASKVSIYHSWNGDRLRSTGFEGDFQDDIVSALQFNPKAPQLAAGGYDHRICLYDPSFKILDHKLIGHRGAVMSLAFNPEGTLLASASMDGTIKLWDPAKAKLLKTLSGHKSWVNSIAFAKAGKLLVSGSSDGTVKIWSMPEGALEKTIDATKAEVRSVAVNRESTLLAVGIRYGDIQVYNLANFEKKPGYAGSKGDIWAMAFSPDGKFLATPDGDWNRAGVVKLWDTATGKVAHQLQHTGEVLSLTFSPDGKWLAAGAGDRRLRIWDMLESTKK